MKIPVIYFFAFISTLIMACNNDNKQTITIEDTLRHTPPVIVDTVAPTLPGTATPETPVTVPKADPKAPEPSAKVYSNQRFKNVKVERVTDNKFRITGKAQIFEASFSWVIEDGHNELKKGYEMTDAGAPEWGNFDFTVAVKKQRPNSTLHLILFESSAKDGSRQYQLPVFLY